LPNPTDRLTSALADRYRVERELGAGGMATVYLAQDLRHDRKVALKVLRPELAAVIGADRFLAEIKTTANLQHPHILPLFDSGAVSGTLFYVMPYVDGESLRDRLARETLLPIDDAVRITREVADALAYAHTEGVIHRDIKPENILLQRGHALVADFGIALAVQTAGGQRLTETGVSIGTPHYMSPEQATGERLIDARSDIYSLGTVTYEMLTGDPPFQGPNVQAVITKALTEKPAAPSSLRDTVPPALDTAVLRALARLPADRFPSAAAYAAAVGAAQGAAPAHRVPTRRRAPALVAVLAGAAIVAAFFLGRSMRGGEDAPVMRFGQASQVTWEPGLEVTPAISPDGKQVAYSDGNGTRGRIVVRPVAGGRAVPLTDDSTTVESHPQWSRDGSRILFLRDGQVFSAPSGGGAPRQEVPGRGGDVETATWSPDEREIAYAIDDSLFVRDASGSSRLVATLFQPSLCTWGPSDLIACTSGNRWYLKPGAAFGNLAPSWIAVIDVASGRVTGVTDSTAGNVAPRWATDGRTLLYASNRLGPPDIYTVMVDDQGRPSGEPRRLTVGLGLNSFSLSADGSRLAYALLISGSNIWSQPWSDGAPEPTGPPTQLTFGQQTIEGLSISRDGQWLFYDSDASGNPDIYRMRLPSAPPERLTTGRSVEFTPDPSPDGHLVAFHSWRTASRDIFVLPLDGGPVEQVTRTPEQEQHPIWSPDGRSLAFAAQSQPLGVFVARRAGDGTWRTRKVADDGHWAAWSPDGQHLSFVTKVTGGGLRIIPADGGTPRAVYDDSAPGAPQAQTSQWSPDGRTIYFMAHDVDGVGAIWSVPSSGGVPRRLRRLGDERLRSDRFAFRIAGGRLYYTLYDRQSNVWVMEVGR
jgi:serine/threonine-protein kinase